MKFCFLLGMKFSFLLGTNAAMENSTFSCSLFSVKMAACRSKANLILGVHQLLESTKILKKSTAYAHRQSTDREYWIIFIFSLANFIERFENGKGCCQVLPLAKNERLSLLQATF